MSNHKSKYFCFSKFYVPKEVHSLVHSFLKSSQLSETEQKFWLHVLASCINNMNQAEDGWSHPLDGIELPSSFIRNQFGHRFEVAPLISKGYICVPKNYSTHANRCRSYAPPLGLLEEVIAIFQDTEGFIASSQVDLFSESFVKRDCLGEDYVPELVRRSCQIIHDNGCPFDRGSLNRYLVELNQSNHKPRRKLADVYCSSVMRDWFISGDGLIRYSPAFRLQKSGRVSEQGGGLQGSSRQMKKVCFATVSNIRNYDVSSSQAWILLEELEKANIDPSWLRNYLERDQPHQETAQQLGISKDTLKLCFYATIMGSKHPRYYDPSKDYTKVDDAILNALRREFDDEKRAVKLLPAIHNALATLKGLVQSWHRWLLSPDSSYLIEDALGIQLKNTCGMLLHIDREQVKNAGGEAAAFILQGKEAAFIHHLTALSGDYGFQPVSNQHDGIVTLGAVSEEAVRHASVLSGFAHAMLKEKPDFGVACG